jgi:hypothetical protein
MELIDYTDLKLIHEAVTICVRNLLIVLDVTQNLLICVESLAFAISHHYFFSYHDFDTEINAVNSVKHGLSQVLYAGICKQGWPCPEPNFFDCIR